MTTDPAQITSVVRDLSIPLWKSLGDRTATRLASLTNRLTVLSVNDDGTLLVTNTNPQNAGTFTIPALSGVTFTPGRDVITSKVGGRETAIGMIASAEDVAIDYALSADLVAATTRIPVDLSGAAVSNTTNTGTYVTRVTADYPFAAGTYGCEIRASAVLWRSVATGDKRLQLRVGGYSWPAVVDAASGPDMTRTDTMIVRAVRTDVSNPIVFSQAGLLTVALDWRGGGVAGTTNILNAEVHGHFYRIS